MKKEINILDFECCFGEGCDCGAWIKIGMKHPILKKMIRYLILLGFQFVYTKNKEDPKDLQEMEDRLNTYLEWKPWNLKPKA